jgi:hypothetical protein
MRFYTRPFAVLIALGWLAAWAGCLVLLWRPGKEARINLADFDATASIDSSGAARWLACIIIVAIAALAAPVLMAAFQRTTRRPAPAAREGERTEPAAPVHTEWVPDVVQESQARGPEVPRSLRTAAEGTSRPSPALTDAPPAAIRAIEERLARHEDELRRLRDALVGRVGVPTQPIGATPVERETAQPAATAV